MFRSPLFLSLMFCTRPLGVAFTAPTSHVRLTCRLNNLSVLKRRLLINRICDKGRTSLLPISMQILMWYVCRKQSRLSVNGLAFNHRRFPLRPRPIIMCVPTSTLPFHVMSWGSLSYLFSKRWENLWSLVSNLSNFPISAISSKLDQMYKND